MDDRDTGSNGAERRRSILRGVYEENRNIEEQAARRRRRRRPGSSPSFKWKHRVQMLLIVIVLAGVVGAAYYLAPGVASPLEGPGASSGAEAERLTNAGSEPLPFETPRERPEGVELPDFAPGPDVSLAHLFGLKVRTIVIDPGHGGSEVGAVGPTGLREKEVALDVAHRLRQRLERHENYRVIMTREHDQNISLRERVAFANENRGDLFISIHVNWLPVESVTSIETYYFGTDTGERALRIAERENRAADLSVAEFNDMINRVGESVRLQESRRLASSIQRTLYRNMRTINENVDDWGVKQAPFVVLLGVEAPSVLAEISVISNREEEEKLKTREHRERLAMFLEEGIVQYLNERAPTIASP